MWCPRTWSCWGSPRRSTGRTAPRCSADRNEHGSKLVLSSPSRSNRSKPCTVWECLRIARRNAPRNWRLLAARFKGKIVDRDLGSMKSRLSIKTRSSLSTIDRRDDNYVNRGRVEVVVPGRIELVTVDSLLCVPLPVQVPHDRELARAKNRLHVPRSIELLIRSRSRLSPRPPTSSPLQGRVSLKVSWFAQFSATIFPLLLQILLANNIPPRRHSDVAIVVVIVARWTRCTDQIDMNFLLWSKRTNHVRHLETRCPLADFSRGNPLERNALVDWPKSTDDLPVNYGLGSL